MIWLIGMMGSGKSAIGAACAERSDLALVDTDTELERRAGEPIGRLFDTVGEPTFRLFEAAVVRELAERGGDLVVATGGGVILEEDSIRRMRESGCVVWLTAGTNDLAERVGTGEGRPLLDDDPKGSLEDLLTARTPLYRQAAHHTLATSGRSIEELAGEVLSLCQG